MNRALTRGLRTLLQLIAAGGLTAIVNAIADGLPSNIKAIVLAASALAITIAQNLLEGLGKFKPILEAPVGPAQPSPVSENWVATRARTDERFKP